VALSYARRPGLLGRGVVVWLGLLRGSRRSGWFARGFGFAGDGGARGGWDEGEVEMRTWGLRTAGDEGQGSWMLGWMRADRRFAVKPAMLLGPEVFQGLVVGLDVGMRLCWTTSSRP
jgi:hypothetical protein